MLFPKKIYNTLILNLTGFENLVGFGFLYLDIRAIFT
jgi:hypothetical protein